MIHTLLEPSLEDFEHYLASVGSECSSPEVRQRKQQERWQRSQTVWVMDAGEEYFQGAVVSRREGCWGPEESALCVWHYLVVGWPLEREVLGRSRTRRGLGPEAALGPFPYT